MSPSFPRTRGEILERGRLLVEHLQNAIPDTLTAEAWTSENLVALRAFAATEQGLKHFPPQPGANQKDAFLWDYIAYKQGEGIAIVAESEHNMQSLDGLKHDFEKLFYAISPIKLFVFRGDLEDRTPTEKIIRSLRAYMTECCSRFLPGELYILYCRTWKKSDGTPAIAPIICRFRVIRFQYAILKAPMNFSLCRGADGCLPRRPRFLIAPTRRASPTEADSDETAISSPAPLGSSVTAD